MQLITVVAPRVNRLHICIAHNGLNGYQIPKQASRVCSAQHSGHIGRQTIAMLILLEL